MNRYSVSFLVYFLITFSLLAQSSKEDLLEERAKLLNDIELTNKLIESNKNKKGSTLNSIKLLDSKLSKRTSLINNYNAEVLIIEQKVLDREQTIQKLKLELDLQKDKYAEFLRYSYKNTNSYTALVYLLAAENLNQFYLRRKYLEQLNEAREKKILLITKIEEQIQIEIKTLNEDKLRIGELILSAKKEKVNLERVKTKRNVVLAELSKEEKELKKDLQNKQSIAEELNKSIERIIREEAKKNKYAALTPEQKLVSENFEKNRGKLPWPTMQGIITERFGVHDHISLRGVKVRNNGIDITTVSDTEIRSIFKGEVTKIFSIKGANYTVMVRHGYYYTVYHNLTDVFVKVGDVVGVKQTIGKVSNGSGKDESILHLEIWKGTEKLNPEIWISN